MSSNAEALRAEIRAPPGERPHLLPSNRKLRHLHGLALRNLTLSLATQRARGRTIDDEALPYSFKSPAKLLAVSEESKLVQSRSFTDLSQAKEAVSKREKPSPRKPRRRSTFEWANATPRQREESLHELVARRNADIFFTLHVTGRQEPIYISEVVENTSNPNFRSFDLAACNAAVTRQDNVTVKFWTRSANDTVWNFLIEVGLALRSLHFIGQSLENVVYPFPDNCIIFFLQDGLYTYLSEPLMEEEAPAPVVLSDVQNLAGQVEPTSSYDALMRLCTLDECIQDAIVAREKLTREINELISRNKQEYFGKDLLSEARISTANTERSVEVEKRQVKIAGRRLSDLRESLRSRRDAMQKGRETHEKISSTLQSNTTALERSKAEHTGVLEDISGQRRRICSDLLDIYPIEPVPGKSLLFTIRDLALPNSTFPKDSKEDIYSAALGHVTHVVMLLSLYLSIPLPYPVYPSSSTSSIRDPVSLMSGNRTFPLYLKGAVLYRFEYGLFLLNKNIELLASKLDLKLMDIRQTLPNLKYLLFVATAGQGELPSRKAGGVRLLMRNGEKSTPTGSRRSSLDSNAGNVREAALRHNLVSAGKLESAAAAGDRALMACHGQKSSISSVMRIFYPLAKTAVKATTI